MPSDGSAAPVRLNLTRPNGDVQTDFAISFDSLGVVYRADQDTDQVLELYAARIDGFGSSQKRNAALASGGDVLSFVLASVDDRLLYRADQETDGVTELWSVHAIPGGTPVKLNGTLVAEGDVSDMQFTPDARSVVYRADQLTNGIAELFRVPADGSAPALLLNRPSPGGGLLSYQVPTNERALCVMLGPHSGARLYSAPLDGGPAVVLSPPSIAVAISVSGVLADGTVLYLSDPTDANLTELFRVPLDGSASPTRLNSALVSGGAVNAARATSDGARIVYQARQDQAEADELFSIAPSGGRPRRISRPLPFGELVGEVDSFQASRDGSRVVYLAKEESTAVHDLYCVPSDCSRPSVRLNHALRAFDRGIGEFVLSPDGTRVAFELLKDNSFTVELHCASSDAPDASVRIDLDGDFVGNGFYQVADGATFTPDSSRIVYLSNQDRVDVTELFIAPSDGSAPSAPLHPLYGALERDRYFELSPDGEWVVYARESPAGLELYSLPLDGHQAPARLNAPFAAGGNLGGDASFGFLYLWHIAPDSSRVVYLADQDTDDVSELYSVPIDGSQAPVKLNGTLVVGGDVLVDPASPLNNEPYAISPDSTRVVYRADQDADERYELYSVPLAGGVAVKLNGALVAAGDIGRFEIEPGSTRVVYEADEQTDDVSELYSVPLAGGARAKLNAPLVAGGGVRNLDFERGPAFRLEAHGLVVYHADALVPESFELFAVPFDGSAAAVRVSGPLPFGGDVLDHYELTPDGSGVVYAADGRADEVVELFGAPLDVSHAPRVLSGPMVANGDVLLDRGGFRLTADGERVIYRADQDTDGVPELYAGLLDFHRGPRRAGTPTRTVVR